MQEPELSSPAPTSRERAVELLRQPRTRLGAVLAVAIAAGFVAWAVIGSVSSSQKNATPSVEPVGPVGLSEDGLETLAARIGQPIYWAGPKQGYLYELTRTASNAVFVRYLPPGVGVGAKQAKLLIVATYPYAHALRSLKGAAREHEVRIPGGGIAFVDKDDPRSVHLAYPGVDYQVEVYDPSPARSLHVARSGAVRPVG
jgi:hypothetical protein